MSTTPSYGGEREGKYDRLTQDNIETTDWTTLAPQSPFYLFVPQNVELRAEYERGWKITDAMPVNSVGIVTSRDKFVLDFDKETLKKRVADFIDPDTSDDDAREKHLTSKDKLPISQARKALRNDPQRSQAFTRCLYRPFDTRPLFYHDAMIERGRREVMRHMLEENYALGVGKQGQAVDPSDWQVVTCSQSLVDFNLFRRGGVNLFPLWRYPEPDESEVTEDGQNEQLSMGIRKEIGQKEPSPNFSAAFWQDVCNRLNGQWVADGRPEQEAAASDDPFEITPEDLFHYLYAVLHAPTYRSRYAEFLRIDFPHVPLTGDRTLFRTLAAKGAELTSYHLLEAPALATSAVQYPVPGEHLVERGHPRYLAPRRFRTPITGAPLTAGRVYINRDMPRRGQHGQYFAGIPPEVWDFHVGGYQVCDKWLKDRRGRTLTYDDIEHYGRIVTALQETIRLMAEIDAAIPAWPLA